MMPKVRIDPIIFNEIYIPYLTNLDRTLILFGGAGSGKSWFISQRAVIDVMRGDRNYLIARQVARTIRTSVFAQICRTISEWGVDELFNINKSDFLITCTNGCQIAFIGLDDPEKIKSIVPAKGAWTDVVIEETTECDKNAVKLLFLRQRGGDESIPKRITLVFNPILRAHWLFTEYFSTIGWKNDQIEYHGDGISILRTWYIHNRFLTQSDVDDLLGETDKYYSDVFTYARWGVLGHVIFTNWRVANLSDATSADYLPEAQRTNHCNGLDFGFSSDPAALWVAHYDKAHKTIYLYDELYEKGLTNDVLAERIKSKIGIEMIPGSLEPRTQLVTCDSAEPKSIAELGQYGVSAVPAQKGKDSVAFGIQWLQQQTIIMDTKCINAQNEFRQYHWKEDAGGNALPIPVDRNDNLIDAARYAHERDASTALSTVVGDAQTMFTRGRIGHLARRW